MVTISVTLRWRDWRLILAITFQSIIPKGGFRLSERDDAKPEAERIVLDPISSTVR